MKLTERFYEMWGLTFEGGEERTYSIMKEVAQLEEALTVKQLLAIKSRLLLKKKHHKGYLPGLIGGINVLIKALGGEP